MALSLPSLIEAKQEVWRRLEKPFCLYLGGRVGRRESRLREARGQRRQGGGGGESLQRFMDGAFLQCATASGDLDQS